MNNRRGESRWDWYIDGSHRHGGTQNQHKTFSWTFTLGQGETEKIFQVRLRVRDRQNQYGNKYLTVTVKLKPKPKRYYYLKDHLGSVRAVVDDNGNVVSYEDFYPFGLQMPGRSLAGDMYASEKYTGHEKDEETGWFYAGARYYDPVLARWMNPDPLMDEYPGWSPYNYVLNNPLRLVDPDGMAPIDGPNAVSIGLTATGTARNMGGTIGVRLVFASDGRIQVEGRLGMGLAYGTGSGATAELGVTRALDGDQSSLFATGGLGKKAFVQGTGSVPLDDLGRMNDLPSPTEVVDTITNSGDIEVSAGVGVGGCGFVLTGVQNEGVLLQLRGPNVPTTQIQMGDQTGLARANSTNVIHSISNRDLDRIKRDVGH